MKKVKGKTRQIFVQAECPFCHKLNIDTFANFDEVPKQVSKNCKHWQRTTIKRGASGIVFNFKGE